MYEKVNQEMVQADKVLNDIKVVEKFTSKEESSSSNDCEYDLDYLPFDPEYYDPYSFAPFIVASEIRQERYGL
jgi:hypothetical protein